MNYAIVKKDTIINIVYGELVEIQALYPDSYVENNHYQVGWVKQSDGSYAVPDEYPGITIINVVITSAKIDGVEQDNDYRLKFAVNSTTEHVFELHDSEGNIIPISGEMGHFAAPLQRLKGDVIDSLGIQFTDGRAMLIKTWDKSGEFLITEEGLNTYIDNSVQRFLFNGIAFSIYN